jgi:DNA invertase Pin-like site-specific DNA recombinase
MSVASRKFVSYLRVSTPRQGRSGLGIAAQREAVRHFVVSRVGELSSLEYVEVEIGKRNDRPELQKALKRCRLIRAMLVVAKLDRLSRNAAFLMTLRDSGVEFVAADLPEANTMTVGVMAVVAQHQREAISARTKAALAAAKARGKQLGGFRPGSAKIAIHQPAAIEAARKAARAWAEDRREDFEAMIRSELSFNAMAAKLNADGVRPRRGDQWTATGVKRVLVHLGMRQGGCRGLSQERTLD